MTDLDEDDPESFQTDFTSDLQKIPLFTVVRAPRKEIRSKIRTDLSAFAASRGNNLMLYGGTDWKALEENVVLLKGHSPFSRCGHHC